MASEGKCRRFARLSDGALSGGGEAAVDKDLRILPHGTRWVRGTALLLLLLLAVPSSLVGAEPGAELPVGPQTDAQASADLLDMDIDQLARVDVVVPSMDIEVTSVTRTESTVGRSAAAIFVITPEMIRRSGATSVPEVLRMVPGIDVARIGASEWAISCRGFNGRFANKLLVQIDGRSIYSPLFSGVYWEAHDVVLEDVERIEVIRGPGATVWGVNAVNGVINVITKNAKDTQGGLIRGIAGTEDRGIVTARYGGALGENATYRFFGKWFERDSGSLPDGDAHDDWRLADGGFRVDWTPTCCDTVMFQGNVYNGYAGGVATLQLPDYPYQEDVVGDSRMSGGHVMTRFSRDLGEDRGYAVQFYYDRLDRVGSTGIGRLETIDVDFQNQFPLGERHKLTWGAEYRYFKDTVPSTFTVAFDPDGRDANLFSYFLQDEITLVSDRLFLTVGSKFAHNDFSNFEYQPGARLLLSIDPRRAAWVAVSRAVRIPSQSEQDLRFKQSNLYIGPPPPVFVQITGDRSVQSEDLLAYEIGYRAQPVDDFSWDATLFYNRYNNLIGYYPATPYPTTPIWPILTGNLWDAETYGGELTATCEVNPCWRLTGSYSYLAMFLHAAPGMPPDLAEGQSPRNQVYFRSSWDLNYNLEFDATLRYVDALPAAAVPSYTTMDLRLAWRPSERFEAAIVGQNLLDAHHFEYQSDDPEALASEVDRGVYGSATWRF